MENIFPQIWTTLIVMVAIFILCKWKLTVEISILAAAIGGALTASLFGTIPITRIPYHLTLGSLVYLNVILVFIMATFLMEITRVSGGAQWLVQRIVDRVGHNRALTMILLMLLMFIPGAVSGVGTTSLVIVGGPVAAVLAKMGISKVRITGMLFILASLGAVAPPVNIWAMIACAGSAVPYVGFTLPLGLPVILLGGLTLLFYGRGTKGLDKESKSEIEILEKDEKEITTGWRVFTPFILLIVLMLVYRFFPFQLSPLGLPLYFAIAGITAWILTKGWLNPLELLKNSVKRVLPLIGTIVAVGILQEVMAFSGVRGMLSFSLIVIPVSLLFLTAPVVQPFLGGLLAFGVAGVFGAPLMWHFQFHDLNLTIALSGLTLLWALGTALPPTAIIGRFSILVTDYKGSYLKFLASMWLPWLLITVLGTLMLAFSNQLSFLFTWI